MATREYQFISGIETPNQPTATDPSADTDIMNKGYADANYLGGASGTGGVNYITNTDIETDTTGYATYADAAGTSPVDGTGGSASSAISRTTLGGNVLRGTASLEFAKDAVDRQGEGFSNDFTIDRADFNKRLSISFDWMTNANYVAEDMGIYIYDVDAAAIILPSAINLPAHLTVGTKIQMYFNATSSSNYRLIWHVQSTSATAYDVFVDNVIVGPEATVQATPMSEAIDVAFTGAWSGSDVTYTGKMFRRGNMAKFQAHMVIGPGVSVTGGGSNFSLTMPTGLTIDTSQMLATGDDDQIGWCTWDDNDAAQVNLGTLHFNSSTVVSAFLFTDNGANENKGGFTSAAPFAVQAGDHFYGEFEVPIAEWAGSSVSLTNSRVEYASNSTTDNTPTDTTSFVYGPSGQSIPNGAVGTDYARRVRFLTPIQSTDKLTLEFSVDQVTWISVNDYRNIVSFIRQNTTDYGASLVAVNSTDVDVTFHTGGANTSGATFGSNGQAWSVFSFVFWRLSKSSNPLSIGAETLNKFQIKTLAGDLVNTNGTIPNISFTLDVGKTYRITLNALSNQDGEGWKEIEVKDGSTVLGRTSWSFSIGGGVDVGQTFTTVRTITDGALTFVVASNSISIRGNDTVEETHVIVEELPGHALTADW